MFFTGRVHAVIRVGRKRDPYYADERAVQLASPMPRPVYLLLGLCLPSVLPIAPSVAGIALCMAICVAVSLTFVFPECLAKKRDKWVIFAVGMLVAALAGNRWIAQQLPESCWRREVMVTGVITDFPERQQFGQDSDGQRFTLSVRDLQPEECGAIKHIQLSYWDLAPMFTLGQRVTLVAQLRPAPSQLSPGSIPDQTRNIAKRISARGSVVSIVRVDQASSPLAQGRQFLSTSLAQVDTSPRTRNVLNALLVGRGGAVGSDDWLRVRSLGLSHVLVISGLHVGLVFVMCWWLIRRCFGLLARPWSGAEPCKRLLPLCAAAVYAALAGFSLPTQRALFMLMVVGLPQLLGWRTRPLWGLLAAILLLLILDPMAWLSSGFWLSVGATGILLSYAQWHWPRENLGAAGQLLLLQAVVALGTLPLSLFWYGTASVLGVLANLLLVPPLTLLVVPLLLVGAVSMVVSSAAGLLLWGIAADVITVWLGVLDYFYQLTRGVALQGEHWSLSMALAAIIFTLLMTKLGYGFYSNGWSATTACRRAFVIATVLLMTRSAPAEYAVSGRLVMLDVGQGLALVWHSGGRTLLFDTGAGVEGGFSQVDKIILPYFATSGIADIDLLVVSHSDNDHSGGLNALRGTTTIDRHWGYGGQPCRVGLHERWPDNTEITVMNGDGFGGNGISSNTASCVIRIRHRGVTLLLTGDVTRSRELAMVRFWREQLKADVLVAAHHGSDTSSSWTILKWIQPRYVLVSAAIASRFGHPDPDVMGRFNSLGAHVVNTAESGTLTVSVLESGAVTLRQARGPWSPYWLQL